MGSGPPAARGGGAGSITQGQASGPGMEGHRSLPHSCMPAARIGSWLRPLPDDSLGIQPLLVPICVLPLFLSPFSL